MGFVFLANLLAWPLITLVYPLYASIRAIESDSHADNRKWLRYWVICGLVMLIELTATKFFEWVPFWPQIKLIVGLWLVVPQFNGAVYAYDNFLRPCFSVNPKALGNLSRSPKQDQFRIGNSEDFLSVAERYVQEKGPEALEKLIFGKVKYVEPNPTVEKNSVASLNKKDDEDAAETNKLDSAFAQIDSKEIAATENKATIVMEVVDGGSELSQSSVPDEAQKEWTCALCQVSMHSEAVLHNHLQGRKHMSKEKKLMESCLARADSKEIAPTESKPTPGADVVGGGCECPESSIINAQKEWTCALCQICTPSEDILRNHLQGKKHKAKEKEIMEKQMEKKNKTSSTSTSNTDKLKVTPKSENTDTAKVNPRGAINLPEEKIRNADMTKVMPKDGVSADVPVIEYVKNQEDKRKNGDMPKVTSKEGVLDKYVKKPEEKRGKTEKPKVTQKEGVLGKYDKKPEEKRGKTEKPKVTQKEGVLGKYDKKPEERRAGSSVTGGQCAQTNQRIKNRSSELWCDVCQLQCNSSSMLIDHLRGRRHLASAQGVHGGMI